MLINVLPDNVLLEIFKFCICDDTFYSKYSYYRTRIWQTLVHVCQRWRSLVFASPRQLELYLTCSYGIPVRKNLVFWPTSLPLSLDYSFFCRDPTPEDEDNIVAALEYPDRVHSIEIQRTGAPLMKKVVAAMRKSFPSLIHLDLMCDYSRGSFPVIPRKFLHGSVPHLQYLRLEYISSPHLPMLLSSAHNLVTLTLDHIPLNGHIPEGMARLLATLTSLTTFSISCSVETSPSDQWQSRPDPQMRAILPALIHFDYSGHCKYLEDFLAQVDMPRVDYINIEYHAYQIQASQLSRFIERTQNFDINQLTHSEVVFYDEDPFFALGRQEGELDRDHLLVRILKEADLETQVRGLAHIFRQLAPIFNVDVLYARGYYVQRQSSEMDITEWLPLFRLFPAVKVLRLSGGVGVYIASALEDTAEEMVTEVLPALRLIRLAKDERDNEEEDVEQDFWNESGVSVKRFPFLRQFSGCPVTVLGLEDEFVEPEWRQ